jgi:CRP-like cAMP-binding protein
MTFSQQRSNGSRLSQEENIVHAVADCKSYTEMLGDVPALSSCSSEVLEEFAAHSAAKLEIAAGETLWNEARRDESLYVVVSGTAVLDAGDDISIVLEPGDYFGGPSGTRFGLSGSVVAVDDVEVLVVDPEELLALMRASSRSRHPSNIEWRSELATPPTRFVRSRQRRTVLAG